MTTLPDQLGGVLGNPSKFMQNSGRTRLPVVPTGVTRQVPIKSFRTGRRRFIKIRVTDEEHERLTLLGHGQGGISGLFRSRLLGKKRNGKDGQAIRELARLARNFNTICMKLQRYEPAQAVEIMACMVAIDRELADAIKRLSQK